jgi:hypothetical protein
MNFIKTCTGGCIPIKGMHPFIPQRHRMQAGKVFNMRIDLSLIGYLAVPQDRTFYGQSMGKILTT